jgi:hypothetical protein
VGSTPAETPTKSNPVATLLFYCPAKPQENRSWLVPALIWQLQRLFCSIATAITPSHQPIPLNNRVAKPKGWLASADHLRASISQGLPSTREQLTSANQARTSTSESLTSANESLTSASQPLTSTNESLTSTSEPLANAGERLISASEPFISASEPLRSANQLRILVPKLRIGTDTALPIYVPCAVRFTPFFSSLLDNNIRFMYFGTV